MKDANSEQNEFARTIAKLVEGQTWEDEAFDCTKLPPEEVEDCKQEQAELYEIDYDALFEEADGLKFELAKGWLESTSDERIENEEKCRKIVLVGAFVYGRRTISFRIADEGSVDKVNCLLSRTNLLDSDENPAFLKVIKDYVSQENKHVSVKTTDGKSDIKLNLDIPVEHLFYLFNGKHEELVSNINDCAAEDTTHLDGETKMSGGSRMNSYVAEFFNVLFNTIGDRASLKLCKALDDALSSTGSEPATGKAA